MNFLCDNCKKVFSLKGEDAIIMLQCPEKVCSPQCAEELLSKEKK